MSSGLYCRNESYHIATNEDSDDDDENKYSPPAFTNQSTIPTPSHTSLGTSNVMMIEDDHDEQTVHIQHQQPHRKEVYTSTFIINPLASELSPHSADRFNTHMRCNRHRFSRRKLIRHQFSSSALTKDDIVRSLPQKSYSTSTLPRPNKPCMGISLLCKRM